MNAVSTAVFDNILYYCIFFATHKKPIFTAEFNLILFYAVTIAGFHIDTDTENTVNLVFLDGTIFHTASDKNPDGERSSTLVFDLVLYDFMIGAVRRCVLLCFT